MNVTVARLPHELPSIELPAHEILEGTPNAKMLFTAKTADERTTAGFWSCDVGRYQFFFDYDELIYVIAGELVVEEDSGRMYTLKEGDTAHFPEGITVIWRVVRPLTKYFVAVTPLRP